MKHSTRKGILSGPKLTRSHSTVIADAEKFIMAAKSHKDVRKVVISRINSIGNGPKKIKVVAIAAGLKITVRGTTAAQDFFVYTHNPKDVQTLIEKNWK